MSNFCANCGQPLAPDGQFCPECGQAVTAGKAVNDPSSRLGADPPGPESTAGCPLYWTAEFPLVTNRFFLRDLSRVLFFTYLIMAVLMVLMTAASGDSPAKALPLIPYLAIPVVGLGLMMLIIAMLMLGNRAGAIYCMDQNGLAMLSRSKAQPLNELSQWLGILSGEGQLWASGVLAQAQEKTYIKWKSVHNLREYSSECIIELSDSFHMAMRVYCPPEIYPEAIRLAQSHLAQARAGREAGGAWAKSRVPAIMGWLALTIFSVLLGLCWEPKVNDVGFLVVLTGMFVFLSALLPGMLRKGIGLFGLLSGLCALGHRLYHLVDPHVLRREDDFWPALFASIGCLALVGMAGYQMFRRDVAGQETVLFDEDQNEA